MRRWLGTAAVIAGLALAAHLGGQTKETPKAADTAVKVIEVTAKQFEYAPEEIRVKKGTRVQLKVRATDRTHGFKLSLYPDGTPADGPPGLKFDQPQDNWKLEKDQERIIEFVAERAGTYPFKCSVFCGLGHSRMNGKLIVEE